MGRCGYWRRVSTWESQHRHNRAANDRSCGSADARNTSGDSGPSRKARQMKAPPEHPDVKRIRPGDTGRGIPLVLGCPLSADATASARSKARVRRRCAPKGMK